MARPKNWKPNPQIMAAQNIDDIEKYIKSPKFTEQDYIDIHSGRYEHIDPAFGYGYTTRNALLDTKHNNPNTNKKALDNQVGLKQQKIADDPRYKTREDNERIEHLAEHFNLDSKTIHDLLHNEKYWDNKDKPRPVETALDNPNAQKDHLYKYVAKYPERGFDVLDHDLADDHLEDVIFKDPEKIKDMDARNIKNYLYEKSNIVDDGTRREYSLSDKRIKDLLNHGHEHIETDHIKSMLEQTDENFRKDFIDRKFGITGGKSNVTENQNPEDLKWNNWIKGDEYDKRLSEMLSSSNMLTDDQAEHVKRHGDFQSKYNLYHNKDIDSRHGIEMFNKWSQGQSEHGYDAEELIEGFKNDRKKRYTYTLDDLPADVYDEDELEKEARDSADRYVEESDLISDWVDDNKKEVLDKMNMTDDMYDLLNEKLHEQYDWKGENPNAKTDHEHHSKLDEFYSNNDYDTDLETFKDETGMHPSEMGIPYDEEDDNIDLDDVKNKLDELGGPAKIDYTDHDEYSIQDHPEYETRESELIDSVKEDYLDNNRWDVINDLDLYNDYYESEDYQEALNEVMTGFIEEYKRNLVKQHHDELYETSHQDGRFVPEHLRDQIPGLDQMKRERKKLSFEGKHRPWLDETITDRDYEHSYGEGQHHHEMVKDYADTNGGSIDVGRMHKMFPALKDTWKKIFDGKGKITSDEIQGKIDALPKTQYDMSYGKWDSHKSQNTNGQDQVIFRLGHSDESLAPLKEDKGLYNTFKKVQEVSKTSGHPTKNNTIAWARVDTTDPKHWFIDEIQSDFGKTVTRYLKDKGKEEKAKHVQTISDLHKDWRENLINHITKQAKKNGVDKISTHSPDSKVSQTSAGKIHSVYKDSYQKLPRKMGFMPANHDELAITEKARENIFNKTLNTAETLAEQHSNAMEYHNSAIDLFHHHANNEAHTPEVRAKAQEYVEHHTNMSNQHRERAVGYTKNKKWGSGLESGPTGETPNPDYLKSSLESLQEGKTESHEHDPHLQKPVMNTQPSYHQGHVLDLNPKIKKHQIDLVNDLIKFEAIAKNSNNHKELEYANYNIDLIKNIFGIEKEDNEFQIFINIYDEEQFQLNKSEYYAPSKEGEEHPTKPYVAVKHPEGQMMWHHNDALANKNDKIINNPKMRQKFLAQLPSETHRKGLNAIMDMVAKDPNRHFIPSRDGGREKMRARHVKSLLLNPMSAKIDLDDNNRLNISLPRHGTHGGFTTWPYNLKTKGAKDEKDGFKKHEQERGFSITTAVRSDGNLLGHEGSRNSIKKTQHKERRIKLSSRAGRLKAISKNHTKRLEMLQKGDLGNKIKTGIAGVAMATTMASPKAQAETPTATPTHVESQAQPKIDDFKHDHALRAIAAIESSGGKNIQHATITSGMHKGQHSRSKYGLMPIVIKETIKAHKDLRNKYGHLTKLHGEEFHKQFHQHPELDTTVASRHLKRLQKHFGDNMNHISMAWLNGITGTKRAIKKGANINNHWHVKKVVNAYNKIKSGQ